MKPITVCLFLLIPSLFKSQGVEDFFLPEKPLNTISLTVIDQYGLLSSIVTNRYYIVTRQGYHVKEAVTVGGELARVTDSYYEVVDNKILLSEEISESVVNQKSKKSQKENEVVLWLPNDASSSVTWERKMQDGTTREYTAELIRYPLTYEVRDAIRLSYEKFDQRTVEYYVKGIGLYETAYVDNTGEEVTFSIGTSLTVDKYASEMSRIVLNERRRAREKEELLKNQKRQDSIKAAALDEKRQFVADNRLDTFDLKTQNEALFNLIDQKVGSNIVSRYANMREEQILDSISISLTFDTLGRLASSSANSRSFIRDIDFYPEENYITKNHHNLPVISRYHNQFEYVRQTQIFTVEYSYDGSKITSPNPGLSSKDARLIDEHITKEFGATARIGSYTYKYQITSLNDQQNLDLEPLRYEGERGPLYGLSSLIIPGLGSTFTRDLENSRSYVYSVSGSIVFFGMIGYASHLLSDQAYSRYMDATDQVAIDSYYSQANFFNQFGYVSYTLAAIIYGGELIRAVSSGINNRILEKSINERINLRVESAPNGFVIGTTLQIND